MTADDGSPAAMVAHGIGLFNRGSYLEAQEVWEAAWRDAPDETRGFLEALVQLAGALHLRTQRGATRGAVHLLAQALATLEEYRPAAHGLDVEALVREFGAYRDWLQEIDRPHRFLDRMRIPSLRG